MNVIHLRPLSLYVLGSLAAIAGGSAGCRATTTPEPTPPIEVVGRVVLPIVIMQPGTGAKQPAPASYPEPATEAPATAYP